MEQDLTRWLKSDLGLRHMCEADLNGIIYHPRHGGLCRRFMKFLAESTLCSKRYPNVTAQQECEEAQRELEEKNRELQDIMLKLVYRIQTGDGVQRELISLRARHEYVKRIEDLLRTTNEALEQMASRPNFCFDQVRNGLESSQYLDSAELTAIYERGEVVSSDKDSSEMHKKRTEERYNDLVQSADVLNRSIALLLTEVRSHADRPIDELLCDELKKPTIDELEALKLPDFERLELEVNQEEQELERERDELTSKISVERQEASDLRQLYSKKKAALDEQHQRNLDEDLDFLNRMKDYEAILCNDAGGQLH